MNEQQGTDGVAVRAACFWCGHGDHRPGRCPVCVDGTGAYRERCAGQLLHEKAEREAAIDNDPDLDPMTAVLPYQTWGVTVFGTGSMNTSVKARTRGEAAKIAIASWNDGTGAFDETVFGHLDADAEPFDDPPPNPTTPQPAVNRQREEKG